MLLQLLERRSGQGLSWADPVELAELAVAKLQALRVVPDHKSHGQRLDYGAQARCAPLLRGGISKRRLLRQQHT